MSTSSTSQETMDPETTVNNETNNETNNEATNETPSPSRQAILAAAQSLLASHGYAGLSMRELAAESGLAKATIYHHFHDKRDLFRSVLERDMTMVHDQIVGAAGSATGAVAKIQAVIRTYVSLMQERRTVIMSVLRELGQDQDSLCDFIRERRIHYFAPIATILEAGIAEGVFRPINTEQAAISMVGMINAFVVFHAFNTDDTDDTDDIGDTAQREQVNQAIIDHTVNLFLHGIAVTPDSKH